MNWNDHSKLKGEHAFLSASKHSWINYDIEKLRTTYINHQAAIKGTELHDFACKCIELNQKLPRSKKTLNLYVNDAIGFRMTPEQVLYFSSNVFGTADAISFRNNELRIHDLKTGISPVSMHQLEIYAALFCLEYGEDPNKIDMELRIYQSNEVLVHNPNPDEIFDIMEKIILFDKEIEKIKSEA